MAIFNSYASHYQRVGLDPWRSKNQTLSTQVEVAPEGLDPELWPGQWGFPKSWYPKASHIDHDLMGINGDLMVV